MLVDHALDRFRRALRCGQVECHSGDALDALESLAAAGAGDDVGTFLDQRPGDGQSDALASSGHDGHLVGEP
jgi:hypothetical protein